MGVHVHEDSPASWGSYLMRAHLSRGHDLSVPMSWDTGKLHQVHLDAHQAVRRAPALRRNEPHTHEGGDTEAWHDRVSGVHGNAAESFMALHLLNVHDIRPEPGESVYGLHARAHQEATRTQIGDQRNIASINALEARLTEVTAERDELQERLGAVLAEREHWVSAQTLEDVLRQRDEALRDLNGVRDQRDEWRREATRTAAQLALRTRGLEEGRARLQALVSDLEWHGWDESAVFRRLKEILGEPVSTVTAASPACQPAPDEPEDDLTWARRFAAGWNA